MKKAGVKITAVATTLLVPVLAFAQLDLSSSEIGTSIGNINLFIQQILIPLVFAIALLVFLYGMFQYFILGGADEEKRKQGRQLAIYAVVGFVLMVSIFGIVNLIADGLGFSDEQNIENIPNTPLRNT